MEFYPSRPSERVVRFGAPDRRAELYLAFVVFFAAVFLAGAFFAASFLGAAVVYLATGLASAFAFFGAAAFLATGFATVFFAAAALTLPLAAGLAALVVVFVGIFIWNRILANLFKFFSIRVKYLCR
jgi:hypothetical protein